MLAVRIQASPTFTPAMLPCFVPGTSASVVHFQAYLVEGLVRWNTARAEAALQQPEGAQQRPRVRDHRLQYRLNELAGRLGVTTVVSLQFKVAAHLDLELVRDELVRIKSIVQRIMKSLESSATSMGLKLKLEETWASNNLFLHGKVPVVNRRMEGLWVKEVSRLTTCMNDELPSLSPVLSNVATQCLTISQRLDDPVLSMLVYGHAASEIWEQ